MYDYDDEQRSAVPAMRTPVDAASAGSPKKLPELQAAEVGHGIALGSIYGLETEDKALVKIGFTTRLKP
jgi:hypothetical protein